MIHSSPNAELTGGGLTANASRKAQIVVNREFIKNAPVSAVRVQHFVTRPWLNLHSMGNPFYMVLFLRAHALLPDLNAHPGHQKKYEV